MFANQSAPRDPRPPKNALSPIQKAATLNLVKQFVADQFESRVPPSYHLADGPPVTYEVRWHGDYVLLSARRRCPVPGCPIRVHSQPFARIGAFPDGSVSLWAYNQRGQPVIEAEELSIRECFQEIVNNPWIHGWT